MNVDVVKRIVDGRTDLVFEHLEGGGSARATDAGGTPLLRWCAYYGDVSAIRELLKPEIGFSHPAGRLALEAYAGVWFYSDNTNFFGGSTKEQDPLATCQAHVAYTFRPRLWLAGDATFYTGGSTTVDGVENDDRQENSRLGLTVSLPIQRDFSLKLAWARGFITRAGGEFETVAATLQYLWF